MTRDRATQLAREYWFELLFGAIGVAAVIELILPPGATDSSRWFALPALTVLLLPLFFIWGIPPKVLEAKQMAGVPNAQVANPILYLFFSPYFLAADLNEVWQAAGGGGPR